ncbi:MAG: Zn-dependent exopeptidase M28 [Deltaproteobacteria bacterium]|nr:Zn-dependent exopeptidase M28 [Deltaproteobacteria bacterium]
MDKNSPNLVRNVIEKLCSLAHRGATTENERIAAKYLGEFVEGIGGKTEEQKFTTSVTYIYEIWWMIGLLIFGLCLIPYAKLAAFFIVTVAVVSTFLYLDWRSAWVMRFPPSKQSQNVIGKKAGQQVLPDPENKIILMAHYDSAPVSLLYLPSMVEGFARSLKFNMVNLLIVEIIAMLNCLGIARTFCAWAAYIYILYFAVQAVVTGFDFFKKGYTNGAADNATGVAVAIKTARRLWEKDIPAWDFELVLTGAEEVGMRGAKHYFKQNKDALKKVNTHVLNFDNIGAGKIKIITRTGSLTPVIYDGPLAKTALETAKAHKKYADITTGRWHTGDFDSLYFQRAGISSLTLSAQDENGLIPNLHRETDIIENLDFKTVELAADFASDIVMKLVGTK